MVGLTMEIRRASRLRGAVAVPSDKSLTHRAVMMAALADGESTVVNPLVAADCLSTVACVKGLGASVSTAADRWTIRGCGLRGFRAPAAALDCGNSGTTMRLMSGILAGQPFPTTLVGDASLSKRPMARVAEPLRLMGASIELTGGKFAPMTIRGSRHIKPISYRSPVASAQVKSCVLLAGLHADGETTFDEPSVSRDHTERMLASCGVEIRRDGTRVTVRGPSKLEPMNWAIAGDISSAAFFLVAGLLVPGAEIRLTNVNLNTTRTGILDVLASSGAMIAVQDPKVSGGEPVGDLVIESQPVLRAFAVDKQLAPRLIDEVPVLAIAASQARGTTVFSGIDELRVKETDRIAAVVSNLRAMGGEIEERSDGFAVHGPVRLRGAVVNSFDDHRIAMAFAVAGLVADGTTVIEGAECVGISFPTFWQLLDRLQRS